MSDAAQGPREWRLHVNDMIEFAEKVQLFTNGMDQDTFVSDALTHRRCHFAESGTDWQSGYPYLGGDSRGHPEVLWRTVVATRNRIAHGYLGIDNAIIWDIIQNDILALLAALRRMPGVTE